MTRLWWVRHGPTHQRAFCGWRDVPADLSDHTALDRLSSFLPGDALVTSSDLIRATATADAIAGSRARLAPDPALREFHFGDWDGLTFDQISARDPDLSRAYWETPGDIAPPNGESWNVAAARVNRAVAALVAAHPGRDLVIVAHLAVILTQYARARDLTPVQAIGQQIDNLSLTRIDLAPTGCQVQCVNYIP
ncbi:MAG: histidine phosphatase family protein [Paracoccaceae bacterium]